MVLILGVQPKKILWNFRLRKDVCITCFNLVFKQPFFIKTFMTMSPFWALIQPIGKVDAVFKYPPNDSINFEKFGSRTLTGMCHIYLSIF
jgi:hypothetical protein